MTKMSRMTLGDMPNRRARPEQTPAIQRLSLGLTSLDIAAPSIGV